MGVVRAVPLLWQRTIMQVQLRRRFLLRLRFQDARQGPSSMGCCVVLRRLRSVVLSDQTYRNRA